MGKRPLVARHFLVRGQVQGVGFRYRTREQALDLGLAGWVLNRFDGDVEVWAEGSERAVAALASWLERGPTFAHVQNCKVEQVEATGLTSFEIRL